MLKFPTYGSGKAGSHQKNIRICNTDYIRHCHASVIVSRKAGAAIEERNNGFMLFISKSDPIIPFQNPI